MACIHRLGGMPMQSVPIPSPAAAVRSFNRFYTQQIGVLGEALLRSPFSLTEARVMFELAERPGRTAAALRKELGLDAGYLSRILSSFRKRGLVVRVRSTDDGREDLLSLSPRGRRTFAVLDARSDAQVGAMLAREARWSLPAAAGAAWRPGVDRAAPWRALRTGVRL